MKQNFHVYICLNLSFLSLSIRLHFWTVVKCSLLAWRLARNKIHNHLLFVEIDPQFTDSAVWLPWLRLSLKSSMELPSYNKPCPQTFLLWFGSKSCAAESAELSAAVPVICTNSAQCRHGALTFFMNADCCTVHRILFHTHQTLTVPVKVNGRHL